jgi:diguanylate cyclase (GGDEF)-like protein
MTRALGFPVRFRSLTARIVFFFVSLFALVQLAAFVLVHAANSRNARANIEQDLAAGELIFKRILEQNRRQLEQTATLLAADFAFREAIATNDRRTVLSALHNHGARIDASLVMLVSLDSMVIADTQHPTMPPRPFPFSPLLENATVSDKASGIVEMADGQLYQMVVVPVFAPVPIARIAVGFLIDDKVTHQLHALTSLEVSFVARRGSGPWRVLASSIPDELRVTLVEGLPRDRAQGNVAFSLAMGGAEYTGRVTPVARQQNAEIIAVLQRSLSSALEYFNKLGGTLLLLSLATVAISIVGSIVIARGIVKPLNALADSARKVQEGDYTTALDIPQQDEIGALATSFNHMREAIAEREGQILRLAYRDSLTDLPNRALFQDRLAHTLLGAKRARSPLTILLLDLDRFKYVNDTLGHHVGDEVLRRVGARLHDALRRSDTVARLGGDEFAVLLPGVGVAGAAELARKVLHALEDPLQLEGQAIDVGASIGAASYPEHGEDAATLVRHADIAMYQAKRGTTSFVTYDDSFDQHREAHLSLLGELRRAVDQNELHLVYQPKIDLATGRPSSVEALLRWQHPVRGPLLPCDFIPFAEQTGYIRTLTRWVLENALAQSAELHPGKRLQISVNVSAKDLVNAELPAIVEEVLRTHRIPARGLCLEITESGLMEDPAKAFKTMEALRELGVSLVIDDFGTGYSSLAYIKNLPVHGLKIDRTFVANMGTNSRDHAIVASAIELGHHLGLKVTAEGVENLKQRELLGNLACDEGQGYFFGRPQPARALRSWLSGHEARIEAGALSDVK